MRYTINFNKTVNQLVPHFLGGRKLILYLQAVLSPLQSLNTAFSEYAKEKRIDTNMTSQMGKLTWYLNRKFSKYFVNPNAKIEVANSQTQGLALYSENSNIGAGIVLYNSDEGENTGVPIYHSGDTSSYDKSSINVSFVINAPAINTDYLSREEYDNMLRHYIEKYRLANKTYTINYN